MYTSIVYVTYYKSTKHILVNSYLTQNFFFIFLETTPFVILSCNGIM